MNLLTPALIAVAAFILGIRVGLALGYRGERKRREREEAKRRKRDADAHDS